MAKKKPSSKTGELALRLTPFVLRSAFQALTPLGATRLRIETAMHVLRLSRALAPTVNDLLVVERKILEDHGATRTPPSSNLYFEVDENNEVTFPSRADREKASEALAAFMDTEHEIRAAPLKLSQLMTPHNKNGDGTYIEPSVLASLDAAGLLVDDVGE